MTRQRIKQLKNMSLGLCSVCSRPLHSGTLCWYHLTKQRARQRKKFGFKPGYESGRGRPAITRTPTSEQTELAA